MLDSVEIPKEDEQGDEAHHRRGNEEVELKTGLLGDAETSSHKR